MGEEGMKLGSLRGNPPAREKSCDHLRYIARRLHERAVKYENLADYIANAPRNVDEAMFDILCRDSVD